MMSTRNDAWPKLLMPAAFLGAGIVGAVQARDFTPVGQWFPFYTSLAIVALSLGILVRELLMLRGTATPDRETAAALATLSAVDDDENLAPGESPNFATMFLWWLTIVVFAVIVYVVGLLVAAPAFVFLTLRFGAGVRWYSAAISAAVIVGALWFLSSSLQLPFPEGLIG